MATTKNKTPGSHLRARGLLVLLPQLGFSVPAAPGVGGWGPPPGQGLLTLLMARAALERCDGDHRMALADIILAALFESARPYLARSVPS